MVNLFYDFFSNDLIRLKSDLPTDSSSREEINKWLACVRDIDPNYYERSKTRVKQNIHKQDETLAEIRSIYFLKIQKGCTILALEPDRVDLSFTDKLGTNWMTEIKCPSYVKEIFENNPNKEENIERKRHPKYAAGIFSFDFSGYSDAIKNSLDKFKKGDNNLLIITDDRFIHLINDFFLETNIKKELRKQDIEGKISSVLILEIAGSFDNKFEYRSRIVTILKEISF